MTHGARTTGTCPVRLERNLSGPKVRLALRFAVRNLYSWVLIANSILQAVTQLGRFLDSLKWFVRKERAIQSVVPLVLFYKMFGPSDFLIATVGCNSASAFGRSPYLGRPSAFCFHLIIPNPLSFTTATVMFRFSRTHVSSSCSRTTQLVRHTSASAVAPLLSGRKKRILYR